MNKCAHPHCQALKPVNLYACKAHWYSLPEAIRHDLNRCHMRQTKPAWLKAHKKAQAYWAKKPGPRPEERKLPYADD
jgi:hypothetical protein